MGVVWEGRLCCSCVDILCNYMYMYGNSFVLYTVDINCSTYTYVYWLYFMHFNSQRKRKRWDKGPEDQFTWLWVQLLYCAVKCILIIYHMRRNIPFSKKQTKQVFRGKVRPLRLSTTLLKISAVHKHGSSFSFLSFFLGTLQDLCSHGNYPLY